MKIKTNALDLYMTSEEVINSITSKNLNLKDEIEEKVLFIKRISWKEIIIKWYDEKSFFCSEYENSKKFNLPLDLIESGEEVKEEEETKEKEEIKEEKKYIKKEFIYIWALVLFFIVFIYFIFSKLEIKASEEIQTISQIDINTSEINKNTLDKANELNKQKQLRLLIEESINKVKKIDSLNNDLNTQNILLSNIK